MTTELPKADLLAFKAKVYAQALAPPDRELFCRKCMTFNVVSTPMAISSERATLTRLNYSQCTSCGFDEWKDTKDA